jgi:hypothetical protein
LRSKTRAGKMWVKGGVEAFRRPSRLEPRSRRIGGEALTVCYVQVLHFTQFILNFVFKNQILLFLQCFHHNMAHYFLLLQIFLLYIHLLFFSRIFLQLHSLDETIFTIFL